mgnify:CR=1 FL=1
MTRAGLIVGCNNGGSTGGDGSVTRPGLGKGKEVGDEGQGGSDARDWSWSL